MGQEKQGPLHGHVPVPMGEATEQTGLQKRGEGLVFAFLNIAANEVPLLGGALNELRSYKMQRYMEERIADLAEALKREMSEVEEGAIDHDYLNSEAFFDLVLQAVDTAARTRNRHKIELVAQILRGAIVQGESGGYSAEEYLHLVSDLTERDLTIARALYEERPKSFKEQSRSDEWDAWQEKTRREIGVDVANLQLALRRLYSFGLLEAITAGEDGDDVILLGPGPDSVLPYEVSPSFEKLMRFLQLSG